MSTPAARSLSYLSYDRTTAIGFPFLRTNAVLSSSDKPRISFEDCPLLNSPILKCSIGTLLFFSKARTLLAFKQHNNPSSIISQTDCNYNDINNSFSRLYYGCKCNYLYNIQQTCSLDLLKNPLINSTPFLQ